MIKNISSTTIIARRIYLYACLRYIYIYDVNGINADDACRKNL